MLEGDRQRRLAPLRRLFREQLRHPRQATVAAPRGQEPRYLGQYVHQVPTAAAATPAPRRRLELLETWREPVEPLVEERHGQDQVEPQPHPL